jgi:hypothetical protein
MSDKSHKDASEGRSEGIAESRTSAKAASENVTSEPQAAAYEPKFKSFSTSIFCWNGSQSSTSRGQRI